MFANLTGFAIKKRRPPKKSPMHVLVAMVGGTLSYHDMAKEVDDRHSDAFQNSERFGRIMTKAIERRSLGKK